MSEKLEQGGPPPSTMNAEEEAAMIEKKNEVIIAAKQKAEDPTGDHSTFITGDKEKSEGENEDAKDSKKGGKIPWKIYLAHILATWGDNLWLFSGGLYMVRLDPSSLRLTAAYGLFIAATVICLGAALGRWIDRARRITAARTCLLMQNTCVALCAAILSWYLSTHDHDLDREAAPSSSSWPYRMTVASVVALSSAAALASAGTTIVLQRDWVVVVAGGDADRLAGMNSVLRSVELTTFMAAPALAGALFDVAGYVWTGAFVAGWNAVSVAAEYALLSNIYRSYPALRREKKREEEEEEEEGGKGAEEGLMVKEEKASKEKKKKDSFIRGTLDGWRVYFCHPVRNAGLGLAALYMTVLGFDNITYAFVLSQGVGESVLGVLVALNAVVGVAGSRAYPVFRRHVGLERTGLLGMFLLVSCSSLAVVSVFVPGSPFLGLQEGEEEDKANLASVAVLLVGITAARFGLWVTDLTITQIIQERVEEERRGVVNGVQGSLNNSLDLLKCVLVILLPRPDQFGFLIFLSFASISSGWALYATYSRRQRGHILPFHSFCRLEHRLGEDGKVHGLEPRIIVGSKVISEGREGEKGADA